VFQRDFGFVEGVPSRAKWQSLRQLTPDAFILTNCPAPREIFPVHKFNTLSKQCSSKNEFYLEHARRLLCNYSVIPNLDITDELVVQLVQRMKELRKRMLDYVTSKCNEKWAEVLKSGAVCDHNGNPFPDAKRVRTYIKSLNGVEYEPFMVAINDHADAMFAARSKARVDLANELMFTHGFQLHLNDLQANDHHSVSTTSFFYVINDGMNNFKSSLKRVFWDKKHELNLSHSRRPSSCLPRMPLMQTTSDMHYPGQTNGPYRPPSFVDPYTGQPLLMSAGQPNSFGAAGLPSMYVPCPTYPYGPSQNGMPPVHQAPQFNHVGAASFNQVSSSNANAGNPQLQSAAPTAATDRLEESSASDETSSGGESGYRRYLEWKRRRRQRRKHSRTKSQRSHKKPKHSRRTRQEEAALSSSETGESGTAHVSERKEKHSRQTRPADLALSSSDTEDSVPAPVQGKKGQSSRQTRPKAPAEWAIYSE
jgi:hypothetical protein